MIEIENLLSRLRSLLNDPDLDHTIASIADDADIPDATLRVWADPKFKHKSWTNLRKLQKTIDRLEREKDRDRQKAPKKKK